jgi:hypothetical protein
MSVVMLHARERMLFAALAESFESLADRRGVLLGERSGQSRRQASAPLGCCHQNGAATLVGPCWAVRGQPRSEAMN